jgi:hypothetical protein
MVTAIRGRQQLTRSRKGSQPELSLSVKPASSKDKTDRGLVLDRQGSTCRYFSSERSATLRSLPAAAGRFPVLSVWY